jgi:hypothetical protein
LWEHQGAVAVVAKERLILLFTFFLVANATSISFATSESRAAKGVICVDNFHSEELV